MGLRILTGVDDGDSDGRAILYCSTSMRALPWMFECADDAEDFASRHGAVQYLPEAVVEREYDRFYEILHADPRGLEAVREERRAAREALEEAS